MNNFRFKLLIIILQVLGSNINLPAQWVLQNNFGQVGMYDLFDINFVNEDIGFVFGGSNYPDFDGYIYKTSDGGNNWNLLNIGSKPVVVSGFFQDSLEGYAVGDSGLILKTFDGGINWTQNNIGVTNRLEAIYFTTPTIGFIGGEDIILKTIDAGITWTIYNVVGTIVDAYFLNPNTGFVVGIHPSSFGPPNSFIWKTTNGGASWVIKHLGSQTSLSSVHFVNSNVGYALGYNLYLKTIDGGNTWLPMNIPLTAGTHAVYFATVDTGYAVGIHYVGPSAHNPLIMKTTDGGNSWTYQTVSTAVWFNDVQFFGSNVGYAAGSRGGVGPEVHKTINGGIFTSLNESQSSNSFISVYTNPASDYIVLKSQQTPIKVEIFNLSGSLIFSDTISDTDYRLSTLSFTEGFYLYKISSEQFVNCGKLIICR